MFLLTESELPGQPSEPTPTDAPKARGEDELREAARLRGLALADMEDGRFERAAGHLERLERLLPGNSLPPINLAICYSRLDRLDDARAALERARALGPDNPQMLYTLARVLEAEPDFRESWDEVIRRFAAAHPHDARPRYLRARQLQGESLHAEAIPILRQALEREPENLVLLADLLVAGAEARDSETVLDALAGIEDRLDGFEPALADYADRLRDLAYGERLEGLRPPAVILRNLLRPGSLYQAHLVPLLGPRQSSGGMFPQQDFDPPLPASIQGGQDIEIAFTDASDATGLSDLPAVALALVARRLGTEALLIAGDDGVRELIWRDGRFTAAPPAHASAVKGAVKGIRAIHHAVTVDELPDLVTTSDDGKVRLLRGRADGALAAPEPLFAASGSGAVSGLFPLDVDHDGDLDLFLTRRGARDLYLQNNGDGSWTERAEELALAGPAESSTDLVIADFEDDGDLDVLMVHPESHPRLYLNRRLGAFRDATTDFGLDHLSGYRAARAADFDNDGSFDLLLWGESGGTLLWNRKQRFESAALPEGLEGGWSLAEVGDFDNDGDQDFVVATVAAGPLQLMRNRRTELTVEALGVSASGLTALLPGDFDDDGDLDLMAHLESGRMRFLANQGGNRNHWLRLSLKGLYDNNAKNHVQGLDCRLEARIGGHFQAILGNGGVNHLGLGARRQADVVRVVWTNGLAQSWQLVSADRTLVEEQVLKGSCPFLYTWGGERFEFITDLMWKSPLGMVLPDGSPAPHQSAKDFVLIPGEKLAPVDGKLWLQVTEELWEAAYVDRQRLSVVDHPADVELVVDEKFSPPPHPSEAPIHWLGRRLAPVHARDHQGQDVLAKILARDGDRVDDLPLTRYQGLTRGHHLELTFERVPADERLRLVLWGWIFPTDTSINFALAQDSSLHPSPPSLDVEEPGGTWRRVSDFVGFPAGKRKAMVVELGDRVPTGTLRLRIATSMQIYWDAATLAAGDEDPLPVITHLEPERADLHYRGYSRLYRESPTGPHLFDYGDVQVGPRFRDLSGAYTRFGLITPLLAGEDNRYVVMNAGDEMTVTYDASQLPALPPGWRRDYVLYTDGWVKDGDLHTVFSQTVEPLPYHGMDGYPAGPRHEIPQSDDYRDYLERYQTRIVTDRPFHEALSRR